MTTAAPVQPLPVVGAGVVSSAGYGLAPLAGAPAPGAAPGPAAGADAAYPPRPLRPVPGFKAADHLGRKGIKNLDRLAQLSLVACKQALEAAGPAAAGTDPARTGVVLATNTGSIAGYSDLLYETLTLDKPYLINPGKFAGSVMNCSAGQMAIRHGLKGLNATVAGGRSASLYAFRHARLAMAAGRAEELLVGGAEELSAPTAWAWHHAGTLREAAPVGEGSAVFVVRAEETPGEPVLAELLACEVGFFGWTGVNRRAGLGRGLTNGLVTAINRALERSAVAAEDVADVSLGAGDHIGLDRVEERAVRLALGRLPDPVRVTEVLGETYSAGGAMQLAALLARWQGSPGSGKPRIGLITSVGHDGNAGALVVRERV
ncbi:beta-ketoacyl synthase N-terminal-like domain-containing protein [Streptomyces poriferorum]|uniref:beta-ketoacyl synthase N-terminal-like domain-containing protein n=1 Tax=Streptomyces TaxID=1883 RepID=UPI00273F8A5C|nr:MULTISPECIES: beta-ketoacyl synthase N-terminal-like domain-containing protein [unclassified Streptomyces]WLQ49113.1 beta-ketoacyl synthase N-terminal-like domain-containing protein [Streptomyces sp. Alt1]